MQKVSAQDSYSADTDLAFLMTEFSPRPSMYGAWWERPGSITIILVPTF